MKRKSWVSLCLAALMLFSLCGCNQEAETPAQRANFANTIMRGGVFAYRDGFIYFSDYGYMYEYDTQTGKTARLCSISGYRADDLTVTEDQLIYISSALLEEKMTCYITRDGKNAGELFRRDDVVQAFLDGNTWYFTDSKWLAEQECFIARLWSRDAATGQEQLLLEKEDIIHYFLDGEYIYVVGKDTVPDPELDALLEALENKKKGEASSTEAVTEQGKADEVLSEEEEDRRWKEQREKERKERERIKNEKAMNDDYYLLRSPKDKISFERIEMSLKPIKVLVDGEDLYISQLGTWQVYHYADGVETVLPMTSDSYQLINGHLLYMGVAPGKVKPYGNALKLYDLKTGEQKTLAESALYFAVLADRYVAYAVTPDGSNFRWYIYDWQTGETKEMVKPV